MITPVDFLHPPRPPMIGAVLVLVGTISLIGAGLLNERYGAALIHRAAQVQVRLEQEQERERPLPVQRPGPAELRLRRAATESRAPWLATLRSVENLTKDPLYLRSLAIELAAGTVKLEAEAPTFAEALAYSEALGAEPILRPVLLTAHEQVADTTPGKSLVRFHLVAGWNTR